MTRELALENFPTIIVQLTFEKNKYSRVENCHSPLCTGKNSQKICSSLELLCSKTIELTFEYFPFAHCKLLFFTVHQQNRWTVSLLLDLLCAINIELTFENFPLSRTPTNKLLHHARGKLSKVGSIVTVQSLTIVDSIILKSRPHSDCTITLNSRFSHSQKSAP